MNDLTTAIAIHLKISTESIIKVEEWANVIFVVIQGKGARFITKRVLQVNDALTRSSHGQALRVKSINRVAVNLYQVTMLEKAESRNILADVVANTYLLTRDEAVSIWGRFMVDHLHQATMAAA